MISFWTMWLKVYHPAAFFAASLSRVNESSDEGKEKAQKLRRDCEEHEIEILAPNLESKANWSIEVEDESIRAGWVSIPGVGEKKATVIEERATEIGGFKSYDELELVEISGFGPKTIEKIVAFCQQEDPFRIYALDEQIEEVKEQIEAGELGDCPVPTHTAREVLKLGSNKKCVLLGRPVARNLRNLYEQNQKKGEELDLSSIWRPDLDEWVIMRVRDGDELIICIIGRSKYPEYKDAIWGIDPSKDLVLLKCKKADFGGKGERSGVVFVNSMQVIEP
jgi:DNA polymerase-3 subunit alpha